MKRNRNETNGFEQWVCNNNLHDVLNKHNIMFKNIIYFQGGYMEAKKTKLEEQFIEKAASNSNNVKSQIFKGVSIFVNGYTCMYIVIIIKTYRFNLFHKI